MILDLERLRAETPGVAKRIHLNNAGAGLMPAPLIAAVKDLIDLEAAIGGYEAEAQEAARLERVYDSIARLIGAGRARCHDRRAREAHFDHLDPDQRRAPEPGHRSGYLDNALPRVRAHTHRATTTALPLRNPMVDPNRTLHSICNRTAADPRMRPGAVGNRHTQHDFVWTGRISNHHSHGIDMIE